MNREMSKTLVFVAAACLMVGAAYLTTADRSIRSEAFDDQGAEFFPDFKDPNACTTLEVVDYDPATADILPFKVTLKDGKWTIPSHYDYPADAKKVLWPGLREHFTKAGVDVPLLDIQERYLFRMALETARCFDEGVIGSTAEANIGSIFGIGFPANTGGAAQFIDGYEGPHGTGIAAFVARAQELAAAYGERFEPPASLVEKAEKNEPFKKR
jgi:hypothetical protein